MKCSKCNNIIPDDSTFCNHCGNKIVKVEAPTTTKCDKCNNTLPIDSEFCCYCGNKIENQTVEEPIAPNDNDIAQEESSTLATFGAKADKFLAFLKRNKKIALIMALVAVVLVSVIFLVYDIVKLDAKEINEQALQYVGEITTYDGAGNPLATATGFVYSSDGKIITNYHVIYGAYSAKIVIDGKTYPIQQVLAYDENIDLVVLKIDAHYIPHARISKKEIPVGSTVYAIGSSRGLTNTFSQGIVTYFNRVVDGVSYIQHDASITNGNSGGPLINEHGEVVGINTWGIEDSQNLNFAVFASELDNLVFGTPVSIPEFYKITIPPYEVLKRWILENYNWQESSASNAIYHYERSMYGLKVSLEYADVSDLVGRDYISIEVDPNIGIMNLTIYNDSSKYKYMYLSTAGYEQGYYFIIDGYIDPYTYTEKTSLKNYTYTSGSNARENDVVETTEYYITICVKFLEVILNENPEMGLSIEDFGFVALK